MRYPVGKEHQRLSSKERYVLELTPADKIISHVRRERKDIFLIGFKSTTDASEQELFEAGLKLLKTASCNLVFANDLHTKLCMVITPEQAKYGVGTDRRSALNQLVAMALSRANGDFTRSTVVPGKV